MVVVIPVNVLFRQNLSRNEGTEESDHVQLTISNKVIFALL